jgi:integrase
MTFLKRVFSVAIRDGLVDGNPVSRVTMARENNQRVRYLRDEEQEVERLQAGYQSLQPDWAERWHTLQIARYTGLRQEEQLTLRWEYIDFRNAVLHVPEASTGMLVASPCTSMLWSCSATCPAGFGPRGSTQPRTRRTTSARGGCVRHSRPRSKRQASSTCIGTTP